jgi:hypothetical protein
VTLNVQAVKPTHLRCSDDASPSAGADLTPSPFCTRSPAPSPRHSGQPRSALPFTWLPGSMVDHQTSPVYFALAFLCRLAWSPLPSTPPSPRRATALAAHHGSAVAKRERFRRRYHHHTRTGSTHSGLSSAGPSRTVARSTRSPGSFSRPSPAVFGGRRPCPASPSAARLSPIQACRPYL